MSECDEVGLSVGDVVRIAKQCIEKSEGSRKLAVREARKLLRRYGTRATSIAIDAINLHFQL